MISQKREIFIVCLMLGVLSAGSNCEAAGDANQNFIVSGNIMSTDGEVLPGASLVCLENQQWWTITDTEGNFSKEFNGDGNAKIEISFVGCTRQQIAVKDLDNAKIKLDCNETLEEVLIVACALDKTKGIAAAEPIDDVCYPTECVTPGWKLVGTGKEAKCVADNTEDNDTEVPESNVTPEVPTEEPPTEETPTEEAPTDPCAGKEGFEVVNGMCVEIGGDCPVLPENATKAHRKYYATTKSVVCIVDECAKEYKISANQQACEEDLEAKARAAREKEQSTPNKLLGAAGMAAGGIGGMQLAGGLAEQNADADAERDMVAYLATFRCDYGVGKNFRGGEVGIVLPAINIATQKAQYVELANDLKVRKDALGMKPGIEAEVIRDAATMGLYDNVSIGKTDGAYTSVARALQDENSADAKEWAEQKSAAKNKVKTGATVGALGVVGSDVGNMVLNK